MFKVLNKENKKRRGVIQTMHGPIYTPAFGPDATRGIIKNLLPHELLDLEGKLSFQSIQKMLGEKNSELLDNRHRYESYETQFILSNTYHLICHLGKEFFEKNEDLHELILWPLPILTDSGGFQVFTLIHNSKELKGKVTNNGAIFKNPTNGDILELTPENVIDIQFKMGSDIIVVLDDCRHYLDTKELKKSVYRTIEWAYRGKCRYNELIRKNQSKYTENNRPLLFCVVQGGIDLKLRKYCVQELIKIGFDGYGFGGWAINEKQYFPYEVLEFVANILPEDKPRYAMGVGNPENIKACINFGYDLFDCVIPTRNARHGLVYTTAGKIKILNKKYKFDKNLLDTGLKSKASFYSKGYIHHLFKVKDPAGGTLLTIHNLKYFNYLMKKFAE